MHFCLRSVVTLEMGERTEKSEERVMLGGRLYIDFPFVKFKFTLRAAKGTDGGAEALPAARKKKDGGEGGSDSALRASPDAHSWDRLHQSSQVRWRCWGCHNVLSQLPLPES